MKLSSLKRFIGRHFGNRKNGAGFTLIELLVVIPIIPLLSSVVLASVNSARKKARDARRLADMGAMQTALEFYYDQFGQYPDGDRTCGWDRSGDGIFVPSLVTAGLLPSRIRDLSDSNVGACTEGNYWYYRYSPGDYECPVNRGSFYVVGVADMETSGNPYPGSPGFSCGGNNWQTSFDWVTGRFEK